MLGAIAGDIIGSVYEWNNIRTTEFDLFCKESRFTDDSVLTVALAESIISSKSYVELLKRYAKIYPDAGYGGSFRSWVISDNSEPYNSFGNGAAMRISPVGWAFDRLEEVLEKAKYYTEVTHSHPEGIKGAQAVATAIYLARTGKSKCEIKRYIEDSFGYDLSNSCDEIRGYNTFDESCQGTLPVAIAAFLESESFESAIRLAVSLGGDTDTIACITGGIAEAFYGTLPENIRLECFARLDGNLSKVTREFIKLFISKE